jgi:hypothetical protein
MTRARTIVTITRRIFAGVLVVGLAVGYVWLHRSYDGRTWRENSPETGSTLRYRMRESLVDTMRTQRWTIDRTVAELGPPAGGWTPGPVDLSVMSYELGQGIDGQGWVMEIHFNANGVVGDADVHPE